MEQSVSKVTVEPGYLSLIKADQEQNKERATNLPILDEGARKNIAEACVYSGYFPNPITPDFMKKYILSKFEFPTNDSCLAQSITELNVRIKNLFSDAYTYDKARLEMRGFALKVKRAERKLAKAEDDLDREEAQIELETAQLEAANKSANLKEVELAAMARYKEAMGWKECVEHFLKAGGYASLDEVPWDRVRMDEMAGKSRIWGELDAQGLLEMTPSKLQAIFSSIEHFAAGAQEASERLRQLQGNRPASPLQRLV